MTERRMFVELVALRDGGGVDAAYITNLVGPVLRDLCDVERSDSTEEIKRKIAATLQPLIGGLPPQLALAALAVLGLHPEAHHASPYDRIQWLADDLGVAPGIVRRRANKGLQLLAQVANDQMDRMTSALIEDSSLGTVGAASLRRRTPRLEARRLRALADTGDNYAASRLADLLADRGELEQLRALADTGDNHAASRLADLLADRGELEQLRALADTGDNHAASRLADLLADRGELEQLRALADTGNNHAASRLADLLADRGELEQLRALADTGNNHAASRLADLLADRGELEQLRALADTGNNHAASRLADLLADRGELEQLRALADTGNNHAASRLADLLADRGELEQLRALADTGNNHAASRLLAYALAKRRRDDLRHVLAVFEKLHGKLSSLDDSPSD